MTTPAQHDAMQAEQIRVNAGSMKNAFCNHFAIAFFAGTALGEDEFQTLSLETKEWAKSMNAAGRALKPHILGEERIVLGKAEAGRRSPSAVLLLLAHDLPDAASVAEQHPALRYGYSAEVCSWMNPAMAQR